MKNFLRKIVAVLLISIAGAPALLRAEDTVYKVQNRWLSDQYLFNEGGKVRYGTGGGDSYLWILEEKDGYQRIRNKGTGEFVNLKADSTALETVAKAEGLETADWILSPVGSGKSIKNRKSEAYVNIEKKSGLAECDSDKAPSENSQWSAQWNFIYVSGPPPAPVYLRERVAVISPTYGSDVKGDSTIVIRAPGLEKAEVKCWKQGGKFGADSTVATVNLDAKGEGTFVFPADSYPHGPVMVRITGTRGKVSDTCWLQLYNKGGVSWNEGLPETPPAAKGMKLVFADDFDKPLSISRTGENATYYSHKPGGGDFGSIPFRDFESPENPFAQMDGYLRIRADLNKKSTGLISALKKDGTGIVATAPCYFECRFTAQTAPGTWPAFWLMTKGVYRGLDKFADELDTIEAYGGEGPGNPNQKGYWVTSHCWNQGPGGKKDTSQGGVYKQVPMMELPGGGGASWPTTFHVYGQKVTPTETIYYCDDIEVARHATTKLCKVEPLFFMINLAIGGNGWKVDLSRYNGVVDMYVDYVRVYQE